MPLLLLLPGPLAAQLEPLVLLVAQTGPLGLLAAQLEPLVLLVARPEPSGVLAAQLEPFGVVGGTAGTLETVGGAAGALGAVELSTEHFSQQLRTEPSQIQSNLRGTIF